MADQNRYNRAYDNDRVPEPEETAFTRIKKSFVILKEECAAFVGGIRRIVQARKPEPPREEAEPVEEVAEEPSLFPQIDEQSPFASAHEKEDATAFSRIRADAEDFSDTDPITGKTRRSIGVTPRFYAYLALWVASFIFTQALHAKASNLLFGFTTFFPLFLLLYALSARFSLNMYMVSDGQTVEKGEPYLYEMRLINQSFLPFPFVEAMMILPQSNSVRSSERAVYLSMAPFCSYTVKKEIRFRFRGTYRIGVNCFYAYDFLRLFYVRVDMRNSVTIPVLPRKLLLEEGLATAVSDSADRTRRSRITVDRVEVGDLREYRMGDSLKTIHWNLSTRSEELIVKDYETGSSPTTYVYCDLAGRFPENPPQPIEETRKEKKARLQGEKEEREAKARLERAKQRAEAKGALLTEEEIERLSQTASVRKAEQKEARDARRLRARLRRLDKLALRKPDRAAMLRDALMAKKAAKQKDDVEEAPQEKDELDVSLLRDEVFYEDMNEFCADGVIELTIATVMRELQNRNEVVLVWYDRRSESGICAYTFRSLSELELIYTFFATAPLAAADKLVVKLSALAGDRTDAKQIFVTSAIDKEAVAAFSETPISVAGSLASAEIILYSPDERFRYPKERRAYIEGCAATLSARGLRLSLKTLADVGKGGQV